MTTIVRLVIALAILLVAVPASAGDAVTIVKKAPPAGTKYTELGDLAVDMKVSVKFGQKSIKQSFASKTKKAKSVEVLASSGEIISKAKITYTAHAETKTQSGKPPQTSSKPFVGKVYILERKGEQLIVTDEQGAEPPAAEAKAVIDDNRRFGKPDGMLAQFPEKFEQGQTIEVGPELAKEMLGGDDENMSVKTATITYKKTKKVAGKDVAYFTMNFVIGGGEGPMSMSMSLKGEAALYVDGGWPVTISLKGPIDLSAAQPGMDVSGSGKAKFKNAWTYK
jgi:hypothetical protein